ncbi:MAG: hypothetical protein O4803_05925, partial [Trichodesmium sp. St15_bin1_1]|nr:hypothetical protein [Trichodesmium sp. St15_bin1_1]
IFCVTKPSNSMIPLIIIQCVGANGHLTPLQYGLFSLIPTFRRPLYYARKIFVLEVNINKFINN